MIHDVCWCIFLWWLLIYEYLKVSCSTSDGNVEVILRRSRFSSWTLHEFVEHACCIRYLRRQLIQQLSHFVAEFFPIIVAYFLDQMTNHSWNYLLEFRVWNHSTIVFQIMDILDVLGPFQSFPGFFFPPFLNCGSGDFSRSTWGEDVGRGEGKEPRQGSPKSTRV